MRPNILHPMKSVQYAEALGVLHGVRTTSDPTCAELCLALIVALSKREPRHVDVEVLDPILGAGNAHDFGDTRRLRAELALARALFEGDEAGGMQANVEHMRAVAAEVRS